jgi:O-acetyl-ADP-ribose deacetylase (regulator of RNase III)
MNYVTGDATQPIGDGPKIIVHVCNDIGAWGAGFVLAISKRWPEPEAAYRAIEEYRLGDVQLVKVADDLHVANMIAQAGTYRRGVPIRYPAVRECLQKVAEHARRLAASVHMPRIGCGLAGGEWSEIEPIIVETLNGIEVTVYDLPQG